MATSTFDGNNHNLMATNMTLDGNEEDSAHQMERTFHDSKQDLTSSSQAYMTRQTTTGQFRQRHFLTTHVN